MVGEINQKKTNVSGHVKTKWNAGVRVCDRGLLEHSRGCRSRGGCGHTGRGDWSLWGPGSHERRIFTLWPFAGNIRWHLPSLGKPSWRVPHARLWPPRAVAHGSVPPLVLAVLQAPAPDSWKQLEGQAAGPTQAVAVAAPLLRQPVGRDVGPRGLQPTEGLRTDPGPWNEAQGAGRVVAPAGRAWRHPGGPCARAPGSPPSQHRGLRPVITWLPASAPAPLGALPLADATSPARGLVTALPPSRPRTHLVLREMLPAPRFQLRPLHEQTRPSRGACAPDLWADPPPCWLRRHLLGHQRPQVTAPRTHPSPWRPKPPRVPVQLPSRSPCSPLHSQQ